MSKPAGYVWLVDDDEEDLMLMQVAFKSVAPTLKIRTLMDGADLLPELQATQSLPNLVLLDLNMIHTGGIETLRRVRAIDQYNKLPVVVLSTSTSSIDQATSAAVGASAYHSKPSTFTDLTQLARLLTSQWLPGVLP